VVTESRFLEIFARGVRQRGPCAGIAGFLPTFSLL
jgi:hypothetical protein